MQDGGKKDKRTFKVVSVAGKAVSFGTYTIIRILLLVQAEPQLKLLHLYVHVTGRAENTVLALNNGVKFMLKERLEAVAKKNMVHTSCCS